MPHLHLTLFGSFGAMLDGAPVNGFESNKVRALLAYLAVESAQAHTRAALAGLFWPECPERQARQCLSQAVYNLRHLLGDIQNLTPFLLTTPQTLQFNPHSDHWLDVAAFTHAIQQQDLPATSPNPQSSITNLQSPVSNLQSPVSNLPQAAALYTAPFLQEFALKDGLAFEEWAVITRERLHRLALHALQTLAAHHESRGELDEALRHARRAVELDPLWEAAHRQVIHLLAQSGARTQALAQYELLRHTLADALGVEPELETQKLYDRLQAAPSPNSAAPRSHHLPAFLTPFIGREQELAEVTAHLCDPDCRLLTILGPGGSGKTRFAVEAARRVSDTFPDGVRFISLAAVTTPDGIIPAVVRGLELYLQENIPAERQVQDYLREKRLLLLLDNYEHLLPEVAWPVQILREAAGVKLLITSRAPLNVKGEHHYPLSGLAIPRVGDTLSGARFSAVQLFVDAAQRAWPQFHLTGDTLPPIVDICRTVDGLPLGVILAAAWVGSYTPNEILEEMRRDLDFLATTWADVPERQRSLRATFAYSWRLLSDPERAVMRALSVFRGGFTRDAAREVSRATAREMLSLANKSLIQSTPNGRFYLHELVRQFAREQLAAVPDAAQAARTRHSAYYLTKLEGWTEGMKGPHQRETLEELDLEFANVRAAWDWAVDTEDWEGMKKGLEGLGMYSSRRGRIQDGIITWQTALAKLETQPETDTRLALQVSLSLWECQFMDELLVPEQIVQKLQACQRLLNRVDIQTPEVSKIQAQLWYVQGLVTLNQENHIAKPFLEQSLRLFRRLGHVYQVGMVLLALYVCTTQLGMNEEVDVLTQESLVIQKQLGNQLGIVSALRHRASFLLRNGFIQETLCLEEEALALAETTGVISTGWAGVAYLVAGQFETSKTHFENSLARRIIEGNPHHIAAVQAQLAIAHLFLGDYEAARQGILSCLTFMRNTRNARWIGNVMVMQGMLALIDQDYALAYQVTQTGVAILREHNLVAEWGFPAPYLACAARYAGHIIEAQEALMEGLRISTKIHRSPYLGWSLAVAALRAVDEGAYAEAVFLFSAARQFPIVACAHFTHAIFGKDILDAANQHLSPEEIADAEARGQVCDPFDVAQELIACYSQT